MRADEVEILLVEDNPYEAELAIRNLRKSGLANYLVHIEDGAEALDFIFSRGKYADNKGKFSPKLILLDLKLPKVSGHQILKEIRSSKDFTNVPVVMLTSSNEESDLIESYNLGVNSYIVKPMDFESFSKSIEEVGKYWTMLNKLPF